MLAAFTLWTIMLNLLILVAVIAGAVAAMLYASVHRLNHVKVEPCPADELDGQTPPPGKTSIWADANKFRFLGNYELAGTNITAWQHTAKPALFCEYTTRGKTTGDFVTAFADGIWLTTSNAPDSQLFPKPPGKYAQTYPGLDLADLWQRHTDMETYLTQYGARPSQISQPLEDIMNQAMLEQLGHVQLLSLWPVRAVWWYFVRQHQRAGLSIMDQHHLRLDQPAK